ncbi:DNA-directed RNA polymerase subunit delta [Bacillus sp. T33-2]|uniref:DNA-directed RNA polymerase subunit delta n=1 Tax=Bacillus sp. T33-2 TaxID=2054168 RepID=UPI000C762F97|nr:DNA-directed RNA polymerase subunit delta [Bacillus sp. T33-2]PLR96598.1 DNA-directed RNA polymerase subunit delta [Bacillus sp. T33-2]
MSLDQYSKEQLQEMSLIEVAYELLNEKKQAISFKDLIAEMAALLDLSETETNEKMVQFYTDLNIDGRFLALGENRWGLRVWYPVDQTEEETVAAAKPKKKKAKKVVDEDDLDLADYDEVEEEELFDDADDLDDDDDLLDDEDELEDLEDVDDDLLGDDDELEEVEDEFDIDDDADDELEEEELDGDEEEEL